MDILDMIHQLDIIRHDGKTEELRNAANILYHSAMGQIANSELKIHG